MSQNKAQRQKNWRQLEYVVLYGLIARSIPSETKEINNALAIAIGVFSTQNPPMTESANLRIISCAWQFCTGKFR